MTKSEIADALHEIAVLLELQGENPFKVRAYQTGARALETMTDDLAVLVAENRLGEVKGIGDALVQKITELHQTGQLAFLDKQRAAVPRGLLAMMDIPGLGAKKVRALHEKLGIDSIAGLTQACADGRVALLDGFGEKTQLKIIDGIRNREAYGKRHLWWDAHAIAAPILAGLRTLPQVVSAEHAGSLRRGLETVGDLDFIVGARDAAPVMAWFTTLPGVQEVTGSGETKSSVRFLSGLQADLRVVPPEQFAFALHHFTGSKDHNILMRQRSLARGWSLSEWGLTPAPENGTAGAPPSGIIDEPKLFAALGLNFIPPELREGAGEIEAAERSPLPRLLASGDLRGAFHNHTVASDGQDSIEAMARAAAALGWDYLGLADHSKASFQAKGLDEIRVAAQLAEVRAFNASGRVPVHVFAGIECDILTDGRLDLSDAILQELDYVVASVHSSLTQSEDDMTRRLVRAIEHPCTTMLGHVTGRLLLARESAKVNHARVIDAAAANGVIIEINANPRRLDMDWRWWRRAAEQGVLACINPDAHATSQLVFVDAGVNVARKGWLTRELVFNTRTLKEVQNYFQSRRR